MGRCVIHIGMHKTGTTSIQLSLREFEDDRFFYARIDRSPNHSIPVYNVFAPAPGGRRLHRAAIKSSGLSLEAYISARRAELDASIARAGERTLLLSGEGIGNTPRPGLVRLAEHLRGHFGKITVVGYVRAPASYMVSGYLNRSRNRLIPPHRIERNYPGYREFFDKFDDIFGRENVHLWKFDPATFAQGCVVRDLCSRLKIDLPAERIVRRNGSLSRQAASLLYTYRKFAPAIGGCPIDRGAVAALATIGNERLRFSPKLMRPVLERHRADIEWVEARCGQSLSEDLGEDRIGDIREESDLLAPDPAAVTALLALLGRRAPKGVRGTSPEEVALLVKALCARNRA